ncbi:hypothetical protein [Streptomyces sp. 4N124]|uniref:hypothetical protein n=1 Tax=Streptomyces sp. 4N124 TaxID=3457420 RepID=UPI003FCFAFEB
MTQPAAASPDPTSESLRSGGCPAHSGAWHLIREDMRRDPAELYGVAREEYGGVVPTVLEGVFTWTVLNYKELREVTQRAEIFSRDSQHWRPREGGMPDGWPLEPNTRRNPSALFATREEHSRLRSALVRALGGKDKLQRVRRDTLATGHRLIDRFCSAGEVDLVAQYAVQLPMLTLMRLFGFPPETEKPLRTAIFTLLEGGDDAPQAAQEVLDLVARHVARRRAEPAADFTTRLIREHDADWARNAEANGCSWDQATVDDEIRWQIWLTFIAGHGATSTWIACAIEQLVSRRDIQVGMWAGWMDIEGALRSTLWERTPLQNVIGRWATRDHILGGRHIRKGDMLVLSLAGANTDPCFGTERDFTDRNASYFSFGHGPHECPFPDLAHTIAKAAIECVWDRIPDVRLTDQERRVEWEESIMMRCPRQLLVSFSTNAHRAPARSSAPPGGHP